MEVRIVFGVKVVGNVKLVVWLSRIVYGVLIERLQMRDAQRFWILGSFVQSVDLLFKSKRIE